MAEASDGSTWRKEADGSVTVWKNGQTMTGRVGVSAPAVSEAPSSSASPTVETPTLDAATVGSSQQTTAADYTGSAQEQRDQAQARLASEKAKEATKNVTEGLYTIGTELGMSYIDQLRNAGDTKLLSDGYTLRREADGSYSASKGGSSAKVYIDNDAVKRDTLLNEAIRGASGQSNPYTVGTAKGYELLQQAKDTGSSVWAPDNSEWSYDKETGGFYTNRNGVRTPITADKNAINRDYASRKQEEQSVQKEATDNVAPPEQADGEKYVIGSAEGVYWAVSEHRPGDRLLGLDESIWTWNGYDDVTVEKNGKTYKATIDREAAKRDPQWAILTAPPVKDEEKSGKKSSKKSSRASSSGGSGTYTFPAASTGTQKTPTATATGTDRASLRKQAATAQKEMGDLARQIAAKKAQAAAQGKTPNTSALEAKYNEAKARYDAVTAKINDSNSELTLTRQAAAPEIKAAAAGGKNAQGAYYVDHTDTPSRAEVMRSYQERKKAAQKADQKNAWPSLPTVQDTDHFSAIEGSTTGQTRKAEQTLIAEATEEAQKNAWRSLPTVRDSERFGIPSQTDTLLQQVISQAPRTLSGKPYLPENDGGFSHSSGSTERQNVLERIGNAALGGLIQSGGTAMDAAGAMYQAGQGGRNTTYNESRAWFQDQLDSELRTLNSMLLENQDNPGTYTQAEIKNQRRIVAEAQARVNAFALTQDAQEQSGELARDLAADVSNAGAGRVAQSKRGASKLGSMALDALASAARSGADMATNALLGTSGSMLPFAFRAFGGGTQQARNDGATLGQQLAYGGTMAAKEVFTEKMFNIAGLQSKAYGKGSFDDYVEKAVAGAVDKLASTDVGKRLLGGAAQFMTSAAGEGLEELIGDWMEWQLPRIYGKDPDSAKDVAVNSLYDFLVGAISGVMGNLTTPGQFTNYDINEHLGGSQGQQVNRQLTQDELLDAAMQAANRGETLTGPVQAANQTTQQTTQGTAERGAEGVITRGEVNKNSAAPEQTTVSPINGPVRSDAAEAGTININDGSEKIKSDFKKLIEKNNGSLSVNQLVDYGNSLSKADAQSLISFMDDIESGRTPYKYDAAGGIHQVDPDTHIDKRDMSMRMKRGQHSFQYDNPEVHEYMKRAAEMLLDEIQNSTRGERFATQVEYGDNGGYHHWTGTKRYTTEGIAYLKDNFGISWDNLARAAENIIKDEGAENYADANRVEMLLDDMLTHGYRSLSNQNEFHSYSIPPNEAYIAAKSAIPGASKQYKQGSAMDLLFEEMDNAESARRTPFGIASRNNTGAATQLPDASASWFTANTDSANMAPNANVAQPGNSVNQNISTNDMGAMRSQFESVPKQAQTQSNIRAKTRARLRP